MPRLNIIQAGPHSLVQDMGRIRHQHLGLAQGGAADGYAFFWANYLLGNHASAAVIEITLGPFEAQFSDDAVISISGAEMGCTINEKSISNWSTHRVNAGDTVRFNRAREGLRGYLGIHGGMQTPEQFGSRSTVLREKLSGFHARPLDKNSVVKYAPSPAISHWINKSVPWHYIPDYQNQLELRIIPGYQFRDFPDSAIETLTSSSYSISPQSSRMGYRLQGEPVEWRKGNIISEGIAYGSVQIPPDGQPIVLLNDRQTIGGYPKVGCVRRGDCYQLAQRKPGDSVVFRLNAKE